MTPLSLRMQARKATRSRSLVRLPSSQVGRQGCSTRRSDGAWPFRPVCSRGGSKLARVIALLERDRGATIAELIAATGGSPTRPRRADRPAQARLCIAIDRSDDKRGSFYRIPAGETGIVEGPANSETARRKEQAGSRPQAHQAA